MTMMRSDAGEARRRRGRRARGCTTAPSTMRPRRVLATASGSSMTSLRHEARPAALLGGRGIPGRPRTARPRPASPAKSVTVDAVGRDRDDLVLADRHGARVCSTNAATSEPRKFSPSPRPMTSGELRRAPTTTPGWSWCIASSVKAPSRRATTARKRLGEVAGRAVLAAEQHGGDLGVGLARERRSPRRAARPSARRSSR